MYYIHIHDTVRVLGMGGVPELKIYVICIHSLLMDEASPSKKWTSWIIEATFSKSKTEKMLNFITNN